MSPEPPSVPLHPVDPKVLLLRLWERNLPLLRERLAFLDDTAAKAAFGPLAIAQQEEAASLAHKLAGSLGMFGYHQGTDVARALELLLEQQNPPPEQVRVLTDRLRSVLPVEA